MSDQVSPEEPGEAAGPGGAAEPEEPAGREIVPPEDVPPVSAEDLVDGSHVESDERRYPSTIGGALYLVVLVAVGAGLAVVAWGDWRLGVRIMGGSLLGGAVARVALSPRDAGMLAVRNKPMDALVLVGVGVAMIWLAGSIPDQPGP